VRRAVISGISGFVGQELARQLHGAGVEVHGLTRQNIKEVQPRLPVPACLHPIDGSPETIVEAFLSVRPDAVFHLAALARREHRGDDILPFIEANVTFGSQLLEGTRVSGCPCFVTCGSYLQFAETGAHRSLNLYAATKHAFSNILEYYVDAFGIAAADLILCNIYGEADRRPQLITDMATAFAEQKVLRLHGSEAWVDLVHVEDVAAAFLQVIALLEEQRSRSRLQRFSVTSGNNVSGSELLALFERISAKKIQIERATAPTSSRRSKPWRGPTVPGWAPRVSVEAGIYRLLCSRNEVPD
jgi:nucleoside-diphosphate-sugar epimerase